MPRNINGNSIASIGLSYNPSTNGPLDDRTLVSAYADLFLEETWPEFSFYPGMLVTVHGDADPTKDGIYRLKSNDDWEHNLPEHWEKIGASSGSVDLSDYYTKSEVGTIISEIELSSISIIEYDLSSQLNGTRQVFDLPFEAIQSPLFVFYSGVKLTAGSGNDYIVNIAEKTLTTLFTTPPDALEGRRLTVSLIVDLDSIIEKLEEVLGDDE
jgi:hypothetical protein